MSELNTSGSRGFIALLVIVVVVGFLGSFAKERSIASRQPRPAVEVTPQPVSDRDFVPGTYQQVWSSSQNPDLPLYGPLRAKFDSSGRLFVVDYGDFHVKELAGDGTLLRSYGVGEGQGPGEFKTMVDLGISDTGEVWVSDRANGRISVFEPDGGLLRTLKTDIQPYRLAIAPDGGWVTNLPAGSPLLFARYDSEGRELSRFGELLEEQALHSLVLDGFVEEDPSGGFVFGGSVSPFLAGWSFDGQRRFLVEVVDSFPIPAIRQDSEKMWIDRDARHSTVTLNVVGEEIHLFTYYVEGIKRRGAIDTYRVTDGRYLYSRRIPATCTWLAIGADGAVASVFESTLTRWQWIASESPATEAPAGATTAG